MALQWLPCQAPGFIGSVLGLVGPVSVYCDWVRWTVWSATSVSVWQHIKLSEQIRPWGTLACCWDIKQPTNKQIVSTDHDPLEPVENFVLSFQEFLDRRQMTEWGNKNLVDEGQGQGVKLTLPGVKEGNFSARHFKPEVRVTGVQFSPTG